VVEDPAAARWISHVAATGASHTVALHNDAGICCLRQGKLDEAETHFREALRLNPGDSLAQNNLELVRRTKLAR